MKCLLKFTCTQVIDINEHAYKDTPLDEWGKAFQDSNELVDNVGLMEHLELSDTPITVSEVTLTPKE